MVDLKKSPLISFVMTDYEYSDSDYETDSEWTSEDELQLSPQQHWEESVKQITSLVNLVIFPLLGKVLGRRMSHLIWGHIAEWIYA